MRQKKYSELLDSLNSAKRRYAKAVVKACREAGLNIKNPIHRAAIRTIASVEYDVVVRMLQEED